MKLLPGIRLDASESNRQTFHYETTPMDSSNILSLSSSCDRIVTRFISKVALFGYPKPRNKPCISA